MVFIKNTIYLYLCKVWDPLQFYAWSKYLTCFALVSVQRRTLRFFSGTGISALQRMLCFRAHNAQLNAKNEVNQQSPLIQDKLTQNFLQKKKDPFLIVEGFQLIWNRIPIGLDLLIQTACNPNLGIILGVAELEKENIETWQEYAKDPLQQWYISETIKQGAPILESMPWAQNFNCLSAMRHLPYNPQIFVGMKYNQDL